MRITASIDYWEKGVLTFDPEKMLDRLMDYFPQLVIDSTDYSWEEVERITKFANENFKEPNRTAIVRQIQRKNRANGPSFRFGISLDNNFEITGFAQRYSIEFKAEHKFDLKTEEILIDYLKSLNYGEIRSDTATKYFCKPDDEYKDHWFLEGFIKE